MAGPSNNNISRTTKPSQQASTGPARPNPGSRFKLTPNKRELERIARGAVIHSSVAGSTASTTPRTRSPAKRPSPPSEKKVRNGRVEKPKQLRVDTLRQAAGGPGSPSERFRLSPNKFSGRPGTKSAGSKIAEDVGAEQGKLRKEARPAAKKEKIVKRKVDSEEGKAETEIAGSEVRDQDEHIIDEPVMKKKKPATKRRTTNTEETEDGSSSPALSAANPEPAVEAARTKEDEMNDTVVKEEPVVKNEPVIKTEPIDDNAADARSITDEAPAVEEESVDFLVKQEPAIDSEAGARHVPTFREDATSKKESAVKPESEVKGEPALKPEPDVKDEPMIKAEHVD